MLLTLLLSSLASTVNGDTLNDIEHIIIFMQENRAFDHYFGTLKGVRGFNDRFANPLASGLNSFFQPVSSNLHEYQLPWPLDTTSTSAMCMDAPEMDYTCDIKMWNHGHYDAWNTARDPGTGMSYFTREGLPYYYALYDGFTVADQYFQSTFTQTNPNRLHFFSGSNGLSVGEPAVLDNTEPRPGFNWTTMAEVLEAVNVSWRVYQQIDNFDDNAFAWFHSFQNARPGDPLFEKGLRRQKNLVQAFSDDLSNGTLPQVSWIIAPTDLSEHASHHPANGEDLTARLLEELKDHPEVYKKSVFILNYDEGGQFFDHSWSPTPPLSPEEGVSTVSVEGEVNTEVQTSEPAPIGLGFRVPLLLISPWTRGNIVVSEVFDHTSILQFLELRFNVSCPNISPWRRAITGDLTSAFDFQNPDYTWPHLPGTQGYIEEAKEDCELPYPALPEEQVFPVQEQGTRVSRALPYEFLVRDVFYPTSINSFAVDLEIKNTGGAGAAFICYDLLHLKPINNGTIPPPLPRKYTVESQKDIISNLFTYHPSTLDPEGGVYSFQLLGPNGFLRGFTGDLGVLECAVISASLGFNKEDSSVLLSLKNGERGDDVVLSVFDTVYGDNEPIYFRLLPGESKEISFNVKDSGNWYDLIVKTEKQLHDTDCFTRRFAGRLETGQDSISDPAMAFNTDTDVLRLKTREHPVVPDRFRYLGKGFKGVDMEKAGHKDGLWAFEAGLNY